MGRQPCHPATEAWPVVVRAVVSPAPTDTTAPCEHGKEPLLSHCPVGRAVPYGTMREATILLTQVGVSELDGVSALSGSRCLLLMCAYPTAIAPIVQVAHVKPLAIGRGKWGMEHSTRRHTGATDCHGWYRGVSGCHGAINIRTRPRRPTGATDCHGFFTYNLMFAPTVCGGCAALNTLVL